MNNKWMLGLSYFIFTPVSACDIWLLSIDFGQYDATYPVQAYGEIQLSGCEREPVRISLGTGEYTQGYNPRYLSAGGESKIAYNLYQDAQHYIIWGDGQQSSKTLLANAGTYRIYAKVEMGQFVAPGLYRDNVQVVLEW